MVHLKVSHEYILQLLHQYGSEKTLAVNLHNYLYRIGLQTHNNLGNSFVSLLVKVGCLLEAQSIFDCLLNKNNTSWNALISGWINAGKSQNAVSLFHEMQKDDTLHPNRQNVLSLLKSCTKLKDIDSAIEIHKNISGLGVLQKDVYIGSTLVDIYAKCDLHEQALKVFDELPSHDVVSWTALISGYAEHGHGMEAFYCFHQMLCEGICPDTVTIVCCIKACAIIKFLSKGQQLHGQIENNGFLEKDILISTALVDMYAKCGFITKAEQVFDRVLVRDVILFNALIGGYVEHGQDKEVLKCFEEMQHEGVFPDNITFIFILKSCGSTRDIEKGQEVHTELVKTGLLDGEVNVNNALIDMYARCGLFSAAEEMFNMLCAHDVVTWSSLIAGYAEHGQCEQALEWFEKMQLVGVSPNPATYVSILKACANVGAIEKGQQLHAEIEGKGLLENDIVLGNTLIDMYTGCGMLGMAQDVFDSLAYHDVVSWTALIDGYAEYDHANEALKCFEKMELSSIPANAITFVCILKSCGSMGIMDKGRELHVEIERKCLLEDNLLLCNTLLDMYAKCGALVFAQQVFYDLPVRDVVSWTTLISGFVDHGHGIQALECFDHMKHERVSPNPATFVSLLKACGISGAIDRAEEIHAQIERDGFLETEPVVGNALIDVYAKCGRLDKAQKVFDNLQQRDVVSWTSLIAGYADCGHGEEALYCFEKMQSAGVPPNAVTYVSSLKACSSTGATDKGQEVHTQIEQKGLLAKDMIIGNALVDTYAQWGTLEIAQQVFDKLPNRDAASCNSLIAGYAQAGEFEGAFHTFHRMQQEGIKPDPITFVGILNACSRAGLFSESQTYFDAMNTEFGIAPTVEHHAGMIDLLCRTGQLQKALLMVEKMSFASNLVVCNTLLGACRNCGNVEIGEQIFRKSVILDEQNATVDVLMSQIRLASMVQCHSS